MRCVKQINAVAKSNHSSVNVIFLFSNHHQRRKIDVFVYTSFRFIYLYRMKIQRFINIRRGRFIFRGVKGNFAL